MEQGAGSHPALFFAAARRAWDGEERLWRAWWIYGLLAVATVLALTCAAEYAYFAGFPALEHLAIALKLAVYWLWLRAAWKCSRNVAMRAWTPVARTLLCVGLVVVALT
jgi:hypothetical protein